MAHEGGKTEAVQDSMVEPENNCFRLTPVFINVQGDNDKLPLRMTDFPIIEWGELLCPEVAHGCVTCARKMECLLKKVTKK